MELAISLRSLIVLLGKFPALSGVDLDIKPGEIIFVRGANGAGKTTLLRFCAGLLNCYHGEGQVLGFDIRDTDSYSRQLWRAQVGYLGHETRLYADLTAHENLDFLAKLCGADATGLEHAIKVLELSQELLDTKAGNLSAGQRRRVAFAGVVLRRPKLWLLDEPYASLDSRGRSCVDRLIAGAAEVGATLLVVTHEPAVAAASIGDLTGSSRLVELSGGAVHPGAVHPGTVR